MTPGALPGENNGGGPKSEAGRSRALANLTDTTCATKHGLSAFFQGTPGAAIAPPCRHCIIRARCERYEEGETCAVAEEHQAALVGEIMALPQIEPQDFPLVAEYAKLATALQVADTYLANAGPLLPGADAGYLEVQPLLKERTRLSGALVKLASELGLSPTARLRAAAASRGAAVNPWAAAVLDADFTAEDEQDGPGAQSEDA